ncbi:PIGR protein, partial [Pardalotus punctatus]|nr:PIGR protein [Pardalotus punctatus]
LSPVFGPQQVYGVLGSSVTVKCFYPPTPVNRHDRKYWCRESGSRCVTVISSGYINPTYQGRVSLTDHPEAENFQINISALGLADAGAFQCGVGINSRRLSHRVLLNISEAPPVPEAPELFYVKLHSTWTVSCSFGPQTANLRRYLCKKEQEVCWNIADSHQIIDEDFKGRVLLTFEGSPGSFSVTMTQMYWEDSGVYYCGAGEYGKGGKSKELNMFIYEDKNFPQLKTTVTGKNGSSATFECPFDSLNASSTRIWCKWRPQGCEKIIDNAGNVSPKYMGRVAMFESPENKTVTIILNQLKDTDEAYYWCMSNELKEQQSSAELKVVEGEPGLEVERKVKAQVGSRVELTCSYPCKYNSYEKYWCKWNETGCSMVPAQHQRSPGPNVTCNTSNRTVVLSFDPVTEEDGGWYWCGVKRNGLFGETVAVELEVTSGSDAKHTPELLDVDDSSPESGAVPPGGAYSDAEVRKGAAPESSDESRGSNTLGLVLGPLAGLILMVVTAFAIVKYRQMKRSDLVSVGSYRTNISMSDFESVRDYSASNGAYGKESQETRMGGDEFIPTTDTAENAADTKKAKRSSKEDADLAYPSFLVTSDSSAQGSPGGDSAGLAVSPPQDQV